MFSNKTFKKINEGPSLKVEIIPGKGCYGQQKKNTEPDQKYSPLYDQ